jgi:hypothetical protein
MGLTTQKLPSRRSPSISPVASTREPSLVEQVTVLAISPNSSES